jgi:uncharacterized membrane protein
MALNSKVFEEVKQIFTAYLENKGTAQNTGTLRYPGRNLFAKWPL